MNERRRLPVRLVRAGTFLLLFVGACQGSGGAGSPASMSPRPFSRGEWIATKGRDVEREGNPRQAMQDAVIASMTRGRPVASVVKQLGPSDGYDLRGNMLGAREEVVPKGTDRAIYYITYRDWDGFSDLLMIYLDARKRVIRAQMEAR